MVKKKRVAIIGAGPAGIFTAIRISELQTDAVVHIYERGTKVLTKVAISGGGRCNCSNTFATVKDLSHAYPRGHRLMKRLFNIFGPAEAREWFETHGVRLREEHDGCLFPQSDSSQTVIDCLLDEVKRHDITIHYNSPIKSLDVLTNYDYIVVATGGISRAESLESLGVDRGEVTAPVPSLFTLSIEDRELRSLMGTSVSHAQLHIAGTNHRATGPLLVTHWGVSGPSVLHLSSHAARHLAETNYHCHLSINYTNKTDAEMLAELQAIATNNRLRLVANCHPEGIPSRLWDYIVARAVRKDAPRWDDLSKKEMNKLVSLLCSDTYEVSGRAPFKDEYVTCGGVALTSVDPKRLESKRRAGLFFVGEVLDIDGVTGGYNFQACWTTAATVAKAIAK